MLAPAREVDATLTFHGGAIPSNMSVVTASVKSPNKHPTLSSDYPPTLVLSMLELHEDHFGDETP